ncbi:hypothetical protein NMYAN_100002 [Nitrosomonas nitrosa]|uniref:Uncharacterized protein n=1 Tax=Nitrosomonas nitrosa TaxID=52442 RepID=A0A8H9D893_9PROT|nr:hypothetical protein NMYAN_100002 [Nitrosomonas nitrosa]
MSSNTTSSLARYKLEKVIVVTTSSHNPRRDINGSQSTVSFIAQHAFSGAIP